eukprot:9477125-Pyramimonas_sp.AAC.1
MKAWDPKLADFLHKSGLEGDDGPGRFDHILHASSSLGVTYFFVLGGFLAFYTAASQPTASWKERTNYLWKRFARLLPTFWVSGIMNVVLTEMYQSAKAHPECASPDMPLDGR